MENLGLISAVGLGVVVALVPPALVWALVVTGLRQVTKKNARTQRQRDLQARKAKA